MVNATGGRERRAPIAVDDSLEAYRAAAAGLRACLQLADDAAERRNAPRAAEYLLGALDDLAPELSILLRAVNSR